MYVARSVAVGEYVTTRGSVQPVKMPKLEGEVKRRYEERHGEILDTRHTTIQATQVMAELPLMIEASLGAHPTKC